MIELASLESVKEWLRPTTITSSSSDDELIRALIKRASAVVTGWLQRPSLLKGTVTETRSGVGTTRIMLREWPVLSIASVTVDGLLIPQAQTALGSGWAAELWDGLPPGRPTMLGLRGYSFARGIANISVEYVRGYFITDEQHTIIDDGGYYKAVVTAPRGPWVKDEGVTIGGTVLTVAESKTSIGANEYVVEGGAYFFHSSREDAVAKISYSYVPGALAQAVIETVGERFRYRSRIGELSRTTGGQETASFSLKDFQDFTLMAMQPFRDVLHT